MSTLISILLGFSVPMLGLGLFLGALGRSGIEPRPGTPEPRRRQAASAKRHFEKTGPRLLKAGVVLAVIAILLLIVELR